MDIIDVLLESHAALRGGLEAVAAPFRQPHGVGWDDRVALDQARLLRDIEIFFASFKSHETAEDELLAAVSGRFALDGESRAAFQEGRRTLGEIMKLFGAVAFCCDGEHVYRVRELLFRLREELDAHLVFEESILFPTLRAGLPADLLRELGLRALEAKQAEASGR